jgi:hypothetical protein
LLDLIAHHDGLRTPWCGDIGNAFITADWCLEKIYSIAGPEFGEQEDSVMLFAKAIYSLRSSSDAFRATFANFLWQKEFFPIWYYCDVWIQLHEMKDSYDYICTHVDDFKIVAKEPEQCRDQISSSFLLKSIGPPSLTILEWTPVW